MTMGVRRRLIAFLCVAGMCCSASGVLPAAVVLLGQFDGDHEVSVSSFGTQVEVRFHHDEETPWGDAQDGGATHPVPTAADSHDDHVITFASLGDSVVPQAPSSSDHHSPWVALLASGQWYPVARDYRPIVYARPPPGPPTAARCLRSVVLLV